jgi:hypothetical protein
MDGVTELTPALDRPIDTAVLDGLEHAIHGHPGHDLRVGKVSLRPPHLPDPFVRLGPGGR